jgi:putative SOS response-associated peptidase YedK
MSYTSQMAERYTLFEIDKLRDRFHLAQGVPTGVKKSHNISPTQLGSVIVSRDGAPVLQRMKWGFIPAGAKDANSVFRYKTYLAKSEGIFGKPTWQDAIRTQRCLVPANGFYEWQKTLDGKLPFYIRPTDQDLFAFAGVYSSWTDPEGTDWATYAIVTTMQDRGPKMPLRRPIILSPRDEAEWLDPTIDDMNTLYGLMRPSSEDMLHVHQVTPDIKNTKLNDPRTIVPIT